jgi:hypothetical protein
MTVTEKLVRLWDAGTGKRIPEYEEHEFTDDERRRLYSDFAE